MRYQRLGPTGLVVSRFALGSLTFTAGNRDLSLYSVGQAGADEMVSAAINAGVNFFDTSDNYAGGEAEILLGRALRNHRPEVVLATKVGFRSGPSLLQSGLSRRHVLASIEGSLRRLGTDWVDVYIAHRQDTLTPLEETLEALDAVVRSGKASYIAFSNWTAWAAAASLEIQKARGLAAFTHGQMYYSLVGRDIERDVLHVLRGYGLGLTVWSPLAFGLLAGKYTRESLDDPATRIGGFDLLGSDRDLAFAVVDALRPMAERHEATVAQVALAWLLLRPEVTSIILGASRVEQLHENLAADAIALSPQEVAELDGLSALPRSYPKWFVFDNVDRMLEAALSTASST